MQPFTIDQAVVTALLFLLGILVGMFLFAGRKWKRSYLAEAARREGLERELELLHRDQREAESLRHAAAKAPAHPTGDIAASHAAHTEQTIVTETRTTATGDPYRRIDPTPGIQPDIVIKRS